VIRLPCLLEPCRAGCKNLSMAKPTRTLTEGQRAYEAKRAAKAGVSLDKWLSSKQRQQEAELRAQARTAEVPKPKRTGFFARLIERAHKPL